MIDIKKQIIYWNKGSTEDLEVALELFRGNRIRHGLFFSHLAIAKILKAHVCKNIKDLAPPIHNLIRLAEISGVKFTIEQKEFLAEMNQYNIEGRYPVSSYLIPSPGDIHIIIEKAKEIVEWLIQQL